MEDLHAPCNNPKRAEAGLAISLILLAILLVAAIAIAIAMGSRSGNANSSVETDRTLATAIIDQGNIIFRGYRQFESDPTIPDSRPCYVPMWNYNTGPYYGLYNPANAGSVPQQYAPAAALVDTTQNWTPAWTVCFGYIYETGVGQPTWNRADFGIFLADIKLGVCQQINQLLYGTTAMSVGSETLSAWESNNTQAVLYPNNSDQPQACFQTSDGHYIYYMIITEWN